MVLPGFDNGPGVGGGGGFKGCIRFLLAGFCKGCCRVFVGVQDVRAVRGWAEFSCVGFTVSVSGFMPGAALQTLVAQHTTSQPQPEPHKIFPIKRVA